MKLELRAVAAHHPQARPGAAPSLQPLDLHIAAGEQVAVIGASGAGKTSLLQVLALAMQPSAGSLRIDDRQPWTLPRRALQRLRGRLFLAPQVPPLPPRQRVVTAVLAGRLPVMGLLQSLCSLVRPTDLPAAQAALARFDVADKLFDRVDRLSGGERQRVGLARALLAPARLWLVDEPLSALDPARAQQALQSLLDVARERDITLVASLHQVELALAHFPRIVGLREGRLVFDLPAAAVTGEHLTKLYAAGAGALATPVAQASQRAGRTHGRQPTAAEAAVGPTAGCRHSADSATAAVDIAVDGGSNRGGSGGSDVGDVGDGADRRTADSCTDRGIAVARNNGNAGGDGGDRDHDHDHDCADNGGNGVGDDSAATAARLSRGLLCR